MTRCEQQGIWIFEEGDFSGYLQCSECKGFALDTYPRCPNCGAKMEGETNESA